MKSFVVSLIAVVLFVFATLNSAVAQTTASLECGEVVTAELTASTIQHDYEIQARAGTNVDIRVEPIGVSLNVAFFLSDALENFMGQFNSQGSGSEEVAQGFALSSSNPTLSIGGVHADWIGDDWAQSDYFGRSLGAYTVSLTCEGVPTEIPFLSDAPPPPSASVFDPDFYGFGGLPPVDFRAGAALPVLPGTITGAITPSGNEVLRYTFTGNADDLLSLVFTRLSGNLGIGIAVVDPNGDTIFQASLVASQSLTTDILLPAAGEYSVGVFRVDLRNVDSPQATGFQIQATLS